MGILVILIALAGYFSLIHETKPDADANVTYLVSEEQGYKDKLSNLTDNPPEKSASITEKTDYYDKLVMGYANVEDYKSAVKAFEKRLAVSVRGLDYFDYIYAAKYYHFAGDDETAVVMLLKARDMLPKQDNPQDGYQRADTLAGLEQLIKEYSS